jgi:triose/dihydroxyacetone kinase / FAD-AMP lyase (cyclizing)
LILQLVPNANAEAYYNRLVNKLINQPDRAVEEMVEGLLASHPGLARLSHHTVLLRSDEAAIRHQQVALISGGGSGHEPAHAGYVGQGMLSAAVAGEVFTSPPTDSVLAAIRAVTGKAGALLIVKNYTGDRLNFGLAAERGRSEGFDIQTVVVADDIALAQSEDNAGRRGLAGTVFVHKVAGAAAAEGLPLAEVAAIAQATANEVATMGVSLTADTEVELGRGIHGEPGVSRIAFTSADDLATRLVKQIAMAHQLKPGERIAVMINNLGATPPMELAIFARQALSLLQQGDLVIERVYSGTFLSSLNTAGVSLSILRVDDERLRLLDSPTTAPAWPNACTQSPGRWQDRAAPSAARNPARMPQALPGNQTQQALQEICHALIAAEPRLTELDQATGDGDLGINLARVARAIESSLPTYPLDNLIETLQELSLTVQDVLAGSSGPLYGVFLLRAAAALQTGGSPAVAVTQGCQAVTELGGATAGDRTMLDALLPFAEALSKNLPLEQAVEIAEKAAVATAELVPRRGRASYLGKRALGTPDPGAIAVAIWLRALVDSLQRP